MANVQIYQLDNAGSDLDNSALLAMDIPNPDTSAASEVPYVTRKESIASLETQMLQTDEYTTELDTTRKTITGAINEQQSVIGYSYDAYDATTAYSTGDLCIYNNVLYKAKQATTGNLPTNTTYWEQTSIADEIGRIDTALSGKQDTLSSVSGTVSASSGTTIESQKLLKYGKVVCLMLAVSITSPTSWATIATLPSGFYPPVDIFDNMNKTTSATGNLTAHVYINTNGVIKLGNSLPDGGSTYNLVVTWIQE